MSAIEARETRLHLTTGAWAWIAVIAALLLFVAASMAGMVDPKSVPYLVFIDPFVQMAQAPDLFVQTLWEGLVSGVLYALIALGFVLIFKASGVFNFAQGIMVVFAALTLVGLHEMRRAGARSRCCWPSS